MLTSNADSTSSQPTPSINANATTPTSTSPIPILLIDDNPTSLQAVKNIHIQRGNKHDEHDRHGYDCYIIWHFEYTNIYYHRLRRLFLWYRNCYFDRCIDFTMIMIMIMIILFTKTIQRIKSKILLIHSFDNENNNNNNILFGIIILIRILTCLRTLIGNIRNGDALIPTTMHCMAYHINDCSKLTSG